MTSSANVDLVRSIFAAWDRGDYGSAEWAHREIEWAIADGPSPTTWTGQAGMIEGTREMIGPWEGYRTAVDAFRQLDDERVLVLYQRSGRGKTSGLELERIGSKGAGVFHVRDGKVTRCVFYFDRESALADLGLVPEDDASEPGEPGSQ